MDENKFEIIFNSLLERTQKGELNWKSTASPSTYLLVLSGSSISIDFSSFGSLDFEFRNERGETVESVTMFRNEDEEKFQKATKLYELVRGKALNSNDTIDKIIKQLNPESLAA